mgnify:CR=1
MSTLPLPATSEQHISLVLTEKIRTAVTENAGFLPFDDYVRYVLYTPGLGYYSSKETVIGQHADFITAPNLHPIFARTLAHAIAPVLVQSEGIIYELGAGTGEMAVELLQALPEIKRYAILDVSPVLKEKQRAVIEQKVPHYKNKVDFLDTLPKKINGFILGNEVLDALPFSLVRKNEGHYEEVGVGLNGYDNLQLKSRPLHDPILLQEADNYLAHVPPPYESELHLEQKALIRTLSQRLETGAALFIDYGFDAAQYYHPDRTTGTMMLHYRGHSLTDPFFYPGLADLTCHVNFSAIAEAAVEGGSDLIGYASQSNVLLNLGIVEFLEQQNPSSLTYIKTAQAIKILINPHEMGELFKIIAFGKNIDPDWQAFAYQDWTDRL